jgi:type IV secretory pathway TraG/TraD family ATPase VirD4
MLENWSVLLGALGCCACAWLRPRRATVRGTLTIGTGGDRRPVRLPLGANSGSHTLIVGATGSGKTVTEALMVDRAIARGQAAVVVDPKGDRLLRETARRAAIAAGRRFIEWTPDGPAIYNPYGHGSPSEIADKALAAERWSEPHYQRQAQRYLATVARALAAEGTVASPRRLLELMDVRELELVARGLADERLAREIYAYLDSLDPRTRAGLGGVRDRVAILVESELGHWLEPRAGALELDLLAAVRDRAVVYFRLDADRLPLLGQMLAAAIVQDLLTVAAACQGEPAPSIVAIDEFSAIGAGAVARLFGRARAAGMSLVLVTQELADLRAVDAELLEQVIGNVEAVIAHRQNVPASAELVAQIAGTRLVWNRTEQLERSVPTGRATRTRGREYVIHPDAIKALPVGCAAVAITGSGRCALARIDHP